MENGNNKRRPNRHLAYDLAGAQQLDPLCNEPPGNHACCSLGLPFNFSPCKLYSCFTFQFWFKLCCECGKKKMFFIAQRNLENCVTVHRSTLVQKPQRKNNQKANVEQSGVCVRRVMYIRPFIKCMEIYHMYVYNIHIYILIRSDASLRSLFERDF